MQLGSERYSFGYNKFRLDVEARPNDNILIGASLNAQQYWGKTNWNIFDFIPNKQDMVMYYYLPDTLLLDNVYMKISFPLIDVTLGRQQISPGVAYAWNPTDIFNHKTLMDPSYEQPGVDVIRLDLPLGDRSTAISIIEPGDDIESSTMQLVLKGGLGSFDFGITVVKQYAPTNETPILGDPYIEERDLVGGSVIGELFGWGVWTEIAHSTLNTTYFPPWSSIAYPLPRDPFTEYILGLDHTFDNSFYLLAEFLHNEDGKKDISDLTLTDYLASLGGGTHSLMQDYAFLYAMHPTFDYVSLSALVIANFNDNSGTFAPQLEWNVFQNTNISLQSSLFWGDDDTEFGLQDWGLRLRVRSDF
ncbi:MAG: hypothetical protein HQ506_05975 [Candidatus Marinimicrobia bacterium]|nr:hypothetical protein [Candidatus Neomarinimicrobiota bacterium]